MLRNEGIFAPLRLNEFYVAADCATDAEVYELAADLAAHASLTVVVLLRAGLRTPAALDAVVDAALSLGISGLRLFSSAPSPASAPALARLITGTRLEQLCINNEGGALFDLPAAQVFGEAVRTNVTLLELSLVRANVWRDADAAAAVFASITAHPHLRKVGLCGNAVANREQASAAIAELLTVNAPALQQLDLSGCGFGDEGMDPIVDALASNTHLRTLKLYTDDVSAFFRHTRLLPAATARGISLV